MPSVTRVAIVEDKAIMREALKGIVDLSPDHECVCAVDTGEEALRALPPLKPDVVLMDIHLPRMSGIECVQELKKLLPKVQVVMVTVYEDSQRIFSALRAGASGYLLKRSSPEQVIGAIRDAKQGGAPMSGEIARKVIQYFRDQTSVESEVDDLTPRQREVLELLAFGYNNKDIAERMHLSVDSVRWHLKRIYGQLHVHSRTEAALKFRNPK